MADHATPNLPSRNFGHTATFFARLGFEEDYRDAGWMILSRGQLTLEFFPYPDLDPGQSSFMCCIRLDDLADFYRVCQASGIEEKNVGAPRLHPPRKEAWGGVRAALIDPDGTLLHLIQNQRV